MANIDISKALNKIVEKSKPKENEKTGLGYAKVISVNPIRIKITNGIEVPSNLIETSPFCEEFSTKRLEHLHKYNVAHTHDVTTDKGTYTTTQAMTEDRETQKEIPNFVFWRGLQVDDEVCYIRSNDSQKYTILWRDNQFSLDNQDEKL